MKIPQPYFREFDGWWYVQVRSGGRRKQFRLSKGRENKELAVQEYYRLMASTPTAAPVSSLSVVAGLDTFLDHSIATAASATVELRRRYYESFGRFVGRGLLVSDLRPLHVNSWLREQSSWSNTTRAIAIATIRRAFRWLRDEGYIKDYPLHGLKAPPRNRRETVISESHYQKMLCVSDGPFRDLLTFLWETGCRPQEARLLMVKHVDLTMRRVVFPASESKGQRHPRVIYLNDAALAIVTKLVKRHGAGRLFRNRKDKPWTHNNIRCRFRRFRKLGRFCAYHLRHTFATRALAHLDPITVSVLMGHSDASTLARTYQHLAKNPGTMLDAARKATGEGA